MFPVPLNSSNMTSSIRLPVSIKAVATIVKLPPSSIFLADPKNFLGLFSALASIPPDRTFPEGGIMALCALASLVMLSRSIVTSLLSSTSLLAFSNTILAT